ncbi:Carboxypeptidase regulatory-like domain-containing protein [Granulicella pectinivorans]|uniref:Carboxypeptidase regulatory-like domain-containing protein n=1 Tax=Granulicella pectinivorans TaxID=474950 RepID=A0A1I6MDN3_9BACT|nr:carboxypeptidase-like regulatory domain-containing protein [Granulicella pectinivorans]SFS13702.1 Carboxypeptidase regulatory-like domain-containing protein [Granulicella pectinivorans]
MSAPRSLLLSLLLLFAVLLPHDAHAQATGTIRGSVLDSSGALIPGASVTVTNAETALERKADTNAQGIFVFPNIPIGTYAVTIGKAGYRTEERSDLSLLTGQVIDLQLPLAIGESTETVNVTSASTLIQTASSTVSTTINREQIQDLPLNGRNPLQLTTLTPGAALTATGTESGQQDNTGLTVNGLRPTENTYELDNAVYNNRFFDSVPILPNPDALQEFTIQSSNYSAQFSGAGALVQLSTRSGTNAFHGSAYEYLRNTVLNSYNHFPAKTSAGTPIKPPFKLNQFGGTIGGPIFRDRTFFFGAAEDLEQRSSANPVTFFIPTAAQMSGNFSSVATQLHDPVTNVNYTNNQITRAASPLSQALYKTYLAPLSATAAGQVTLSPNSNVSSTQYLVKIDHKISASNQVSGRYFYNQNNFQRTFTAPTGFFASNLFRNQSLALSDTHIFSSTLTGTVTVSAGRFARTQIPVAPGLQSLQSLGQNVPLGTQVPIFPGIRANISGFVNIFSGGALTQASTTFDERVNFIKLLHRHTISFGGEFERSRINANDYSYVPGDNQFSGARTGNAAADFYLGYESTFTQDNGRTFYLRENRPSLFIQDDFKVTRDLTINAGIRWEPWLPPTDLNQSLVGFQAGYRSTVAPNAPAGLQFLGDPGVQSSIFKNNWKTFGPRLGFAYNVGGSNRFVIRGAYGLFYGFPEGLLYQRTNQTQPRNFALSIANPANAWDNIFAGTTSPFPRAHTPVSQFATYQFTLPVAGGVLDSNSKVATIQDRNITFEAQINRTTAVSIAYVGNHAQHIMGSRQLNPGVYAAGATLANIQSRRLYQGLGAVEVASSYEYADYNGLQVNVTRRVSQGLHVLTNLTYGKVIDNNSSAIEGNAGPPNPFNLNSSRGPADYDVRLRYNLSALYDLPKFNTNRTLGAIINGWQVNTILSAASGTPITVTSGTDRSLSGVGNDYADLIGNPARVSGASYLNAYFNTAAFQQAATGTFGNSSRGILRGPGSLNVDASGFKVFPIAERFKLQFRAEAFNVINRSNYSNPGSTVASTSTFGRITAAGSPRVLQFALRANF